MWIRLFCVCVRAVKLFVRRDALSAFGGTRARCLYTTNVKHFKDSPSINQYTGELLSGSFSFFKDGYEFNIYISPDGEKTEIDIDMEKLDKSVESLNG